MLKQCIGTRNYSNISINIYYMTYLRINLVAFIACQEHNKDRFLAIAPMGCIHLTYLLLQHHLCQKTRITGSENVS